MPATIVYRAAIALLFLFILIAPAVAASDRVDQRPGLMWNRSGLPAVFPLQVKTPAGADYFLVLTDTTTGEAALAAYIRGGSFFRVLVPPGTFTLRFASGQIWRGEEALFGPDDKTEVFDFGQPLTFSAQGIGTKAGHLVTIDRQPNGDLASLTVRGQFICQVEGPENGPSKPPPTPWSSQTPNSSITANRPRPGDVILPGYTSAPIGPLQGDRNIRSLYQPGSSTANFSYRSFTCG